MVQNFHVGEEGMPWNETNKNLTSFKVISFVFLLPVHLSFSSKEIS